MQVYVDTLSLSASYGLDYPGRGCQIEVTSDQTIFEGTHVPGALELHGLEKASSALLFFF